MCRKTICRAISAGAAMPFATRTRLVACCSPLQSSAPITMATTTGINGPNQRVAPTQLPAADDAV